MLSVHDEDGLALEANPATVCEGGERLVYGLTGSANELGDFFLGEVMVHAEGAALLNTEAVSQLQQSLGNAARNVGEDEVREVSVGAAQAAGQNAQELLCNSRVIRDPLLEHLGVHGCGLDLGHTDRGGGTRTRIEDGQLAEHVRRAHHSQEVLAAVRRVAGKLNLARSDDVETITWLALLKDGGSTRETHGFHLLNEVLYCDGINALENTSPRKNVLYAFHVLLLEVGGVVVKKCPESFRASDACVSKNQKFSSETGARPYATNLILQCNLSLYVTL